MTIRPSLIPNPFADPAPLRIRWISLMLAGALIVVACILAALRLWGTKTEHAAMAGRVTREAEVRQ